MKGIILYNPARLVFGAASLGKITPDCLERDIKRLFILAAEPVLPLLEGLFSQLEDAGIEYSIDSSLSSEPGTDDFKRICAAADRFHPDCVAGIGGGSIMDTAKLIAAFNGQGVDIRHYFGSGMIKGRNTPLICVPTTSGTGSEVSPNSIILDEEERTKKGIISPFLVPDAAYVDPELSLGLPPALTAHTGMDAFTHCLEAYTNKYAHPIVDNLAFQGMRLISSSLEKACRVGSDLDARADLALGSMYGGMCLGPVNTAAVHALAYPLGSEYGIGHGLSNAVLLPHVTEFNMLGPAVEKYASLDRALGILVRGDARERGGRELDRIRILIKNCEIPSRLRDLGIEKSTLPSMAHTASGIERLLRNNPRDIREKEILEIYQKAY